MNSRLIVLSGATRGLGRAMVAGFAQAGYLVAGCARSSAAIKQVPQNFAPPHDFSPVDVAQDEQIARWAKQVLDRLGPPDLLIKHNETHGPIYLDTRYAA